MWPWQNKNLYDQQDLKIFYGKGHDTKLYEIFKCNK